MVHELAAGVRGATAIRVTRGIKDEEGNAITVEGVFGVVVEGEFVADAELARYGRTVSQWEVEVFQAFAAARGNLPGDTRFSDVVAFWDEHNLWDRANQVPAPDGNE